MAKGYTVMTAGLWHRWYGDLVLSTEKKLKQWLKKEVGLVPGTTENWFTAKLEVTSLGVCCQ